MSFFRAIHLAIFAVLAMGTPSHSFESSVGGLNVSLVADGLDEPWAVDFLPGGDILVTERDGILWRIAPDGSRNQIAGLPKIFLDGQGGLLDVMVPKDFATSREIYISFAVKQGFGSGTALAKGVLNENATELRDTRTIFEMARGNKGGVHFGSRIVEANDGTIFLTLGDRGRREQAQSLTNHNGSVVRLSRNGEVPSDNPFIDTPGLKPEIYSYGHRNPQGAALGLDGTLWVVEHGAKGGDEVNKVKPGANYGWPVISYGTHYSGQKIGIGSAALGMEQPEHYWDPSIAPSGMMIYSGKLWPEWKGHIFVGSLKFNYISRLSGTDLIEVEQLQSNETERVRDVVEGPDGAIWFLSVGNGSLYKVTP